MNSNNSYFIRLV